VLRSLDTTTPGGKALFQMMGVFAEFERAMVQERVRAGLARAKSEGKQLGRPPVAPELEKRIRAALNALRRTEGIRKIAERLGVSPGTVQRISALSSRQTWAREAVGASAPRIRAMMRSPLAAQPGDEPLRA
jgi:DNA invertase Pin-like site-specific DNA recombinase